MTATTTPVKFDGRVFPGMPRGVQRFFAQVKLTAVGAGTSEHRFEMNPAADRSFQKWFQISRIAVKIDVAPVAVLGVAVVRSSTNWEDNIIPDNGWIGGFQMATFIDANNQFGQLSTPINLGRLVVGTAGRLSVFLEQVDTAVQHVNISGFASDFPLVANNNWRA